MYFYTLAFSQWNILKFKSGWVTLRCRTIVLSATIIRDHRLWGKIIRGRGRRKWEVYNSRTKGISNSPFLRANITSTMFIGRCAVYICLVLWTHSPFSTLLLGRSLGNLVLKLLAEASRLGIPTRDERWRSNKEGTQFSCFLPIGHEGWLHSSPKDHSPVTGTPFLTFLL